MHDKEKLILPDFFNRNAGTYLLACSAGIDSCVLAHIMHTYKITFALAHYNYRLRANESDGDQEFVNLLAKKYKVPFYTITQPLKKQAGVSVQMQARDMRYAWLQEICANNNFTYLLTAHHANDQAETLFLHLFRGSGLKGLTGMKMKQGFHLRPLLTVSKSEIEAYAKKNKLTWRTDSSNKKNTYDRNYIRNVLIPAIEKRWPGAVERISKNANNLQREHELLEHLSQREILRFVQRKKNTAVIQIASLCKHTDAEMLLFSFLSTYGFNYDQCVTALQHSNDTENKEIHSGTHTIHIKGGKCTLLPRQQLVSETVVTIKKQVKKIAHPLNLEFKQTLKKPAIPATATVACMDANCIAWPLTLRIWQPGDWLKPLGMKGKKKISDLLTDKKLTAPEKQNTWVLCDTEKIIWVPGIRLDDRVKITPKTVKYLTIELK